MRGAPPSVGLRLEAKRQLGGLPRCLTGRRLLVLAEDGSQPPYRAAWAGVQHFQLESQDRPHEDFSVEFSGTTKPPEPFDSKGLDGSGGVLRHGLYPAGAAGAAGGGA